MTREEKAKRYDEALEWMRELYPGLHGATKEDAEHYFPKLKESEDERMLGAIRLALTDVPEERFTTEGTSFLKVLAWLEKQREASKAIETVEKIDKYIDKHLANAHDMKDSNPEKKYYRGWDDALGKIAGILQDVYSGEKQKESPKSADSISSDCTSDAKCEDRSPKHNISVDEIAQDYIDGVKEYNPEPTWDLMQTAVCYGYHYCEQKEQKPAEWSEDDEHRRKDAIYFLETARKHYADTSEIELTIDWLKSLRPVSKESLQPHWKPSEEQMEALSETMTMSLMITLRLLT